VHINVRQGLIEIRRKITENGYSATHYAVFESKIATVAPLFRQKQSQLLQFTKQYDIIN
jgi:hypothetical protein